MALEDDVQRMVGEIQQLVTTLRSLNTTLGSNTRDDAVVRAIAQMTAQLNQGNRTQRQQAAAVDQFVRQVKSATQANNSQVRSSGDVADANREQAESTRELTGQQEANRRALEAYREQQQKNINFAGILAREKLAEARAGRTLTSALEKYAGDNVEAQMRLQQAIAGFNTLKDITGTLKNFGMELANGNTSFGTLNPVVDTLAKVIGSVVGGIPLIGGALRGMAEGAAEGFKFLLTQLETASQTFNQVAQAGALTERGMTGVQEQFLRSGLSLEAYRQVVSENSATLARFGGSVGRGAEQFTRVLGSIVDSEAGDQLRRIGFSADQIGETTAAFLAQQTRLGLSQNRTQNQLRQGSIQYAQELDRLAKLTGMQRKEIQAQQDAALGEARFRATYDDMVASGQETQAKAMLDFQTMVNKASTEMGQGMRDLAGGFTESDAAIKLFNSTGGAAADIMAQVKSGQIDQVTAFKMLQDATRQNIGLSRSLAQAVGNGTNAFVDYAQQSDLVNAKVIDGQVILDEQNRQMTKGTDTLTDSTVDAQKNLQQLSRQLSNFALGLMPAASAAVSGFTNVLNQGIQAIAKATGIELKNITDMGRAAAATAAPETVYPSTAADMAAGAPTQSAAPMERNAVTDAARGAGAALQGLGLGPRAGQPTPKPEASAGPVAPPSPPPRPGLEQSNETLRKLGLRIKEGDVQQEGKTVSPKILKMAQEIQANLKGFRYFSGFNDKYHNENVPSSFHTRGQALDFTMDRRPTVEEGRKILQMLKGMGADYARDEYNFPSSNSTAGHFHAHVREFARGGIARGPESGYPATLHGAEAVVPLPDGRAIPVKIELPEIRNPFAEMSAPTDTPDLEAAVDRMGQQIRTALEEVMRSYRSNPAMESALTELVNLQRNNNSTTERLLQASVN